MKSQELVTSAERIVKELSARVNKGQIGMRDAEQEILQFVNWVGDLMAQEVVEGVAEPTRANRIIVDGEVAVLEQVRNLRFINRFGEYVVRPRRCYKFLNQPDSFAPLDAKLGIEGCFGFSPLMTMLICLLGAEEPFERSATKLEALLGPRSSAYLGTGFVSARCSVRIDREVAALYRRLGVVEVTPPVRGRRTILAAGQIAPSTARTTLVFPMPVSFSPRGTVRMALPLRP